MIGRIKGILIEKKAPDLLIDVQGLGYEVLVPMTTYYQLPSEGQSVTLHTHFVVREDVQMLFGFISLDDRRMFRELIKINGVGPKMALAILSGMNTHDFIHLVMENDYVGLTALPGVGKKTAERLVVEMKDRLKNWSFDLSVVGNQTPSQSVSPSQHHEQDAISALVSLGYNPQQAAKTIAKVAKEVSTTEEMIRLALKSM